MDTLLRNTASPTLPENPSGERGSGLPTALNETFSEPEPRLTALAKRLVMESPVDPDRVRRLSDEIRSGAYRSDPWLAAGRLIGLELNLP